MEILRNKIIDFSDTFLILGFFDGIHAGHIELIKTATEDAEKQGRKTVLVTLSQSPAVYFGKKAEYLMPREASYRLIENLGVNYLCESDFEKLVNITAEDYLKKIKAQFLPLRIYTGFNYTFGFNREGTPNLLSEMQDKYHYKYICVPEYKMDDYTISSTLIKEFLKKGDIKTANKFLTRPFTLTSTVEKGMQFGRILGFPTANMKYPKDIIKLPYGVFKARVFNKPAILNWGTRPTVNEKEELLELHIPNFSKNLYNKILTVEILEKIRDEQKFETPELLKLQIEKDVKECLK